MPGGVQSPVFSKHRIVGGGRRSGVRCPSCLATDRERLVFMFLHPLLGACKPPARVLHVAPEPATSRVLRRLPGIKYFTADLTLQRGPELQTDITRIALRAESVDILICNHVLEHVVEDRQAALEIHRVLTPDGVAVLQVPICLSRGRSIEGALGLSETTRLRSLGQSDHVRIYGYAAYVSLLRSVGFAVRRWRLADSIHQSEIEVFGLNPAESVYVCYKQKAISADLWRESERSLVDCVRRLWSLCDSQSLLF